MAGPEAFAGSVASGSIMSGAGAGGGLMGSLMTANPMMMGIAGGGLLMGLLGGKKRPRQTQITLTPGLNNLQKVIDASLTKGMPKNMADIFTGQAIKMLREKRRAAGQQVQAAGFADSETVRSGRTTSRGLMAQSGLRTAGEGMKYVPAFMEEKSYNIGRFGDMQERIRQSTAKTYRMAKAGTQKDEFHQMRRANRASMMSGFGQLAAMGAMMG